MNTEDSLYQDRQMFTQGLPDGVIAKADITRFAEILSAHGLFDEHTRPNLRASVQKLKPEWNKNHACYGWTDEDTL